MLGKLCYGLGYHDVRVEGFIYSLSCCCLQTIFTIADLLTTSPCARWSRTLTQVHIHTMYLQTSYTSNVLTGNTPFLCSQIIRYRVRRQAQKRPLWLPIHHQNSQRCVTYSSHTTVTWHQYDTPEATTRSGPKLISHGVLSLKINE